MAQFMPKLQYLNTIILRDQCNAVGNFLVYMFLGSPPPPQICAIELRRYSCSTLARGKRKHIMRFEIRYFFLEIGLSPSGLTQPQEKSI